MAGSKYNATVYSKINGKVVGTFIAQVNDEGKMLRSNWVQGTRYDGTDIYDMYLRLRFPNEEFEIVQDGGQGYRDRLSGLALPPAYK